MSGSLAPTLRPLQRRDGPLQGNHGPCFGVQRLPSALPPILSDSNPFAGCAAKNVHQDESSLTFDIVCGGRDAAKAKATYTLAPGGLHARISMKMGAKNMTMTEVQTGRRIGSCPLAVMLPKLISKRTSLRCEPT